MIDLKTTRYSTVVAAFVERYPDAEARLDKRRVAGPVASWCTNAALREAVDFSLTLGDDELLGFHDGPRNMWASSEALPLVDELASQRVLRYRVSRFSLPLLAGPFAASLAVAPVACRSSASCLPWRWRRPARLEGRT